MWNDPLTAILATNYSYTTRAALTNLYWCTSANWDWVLNARKYWSRHWMSIKWHAIAHSTLSKWKKETSGTNGYFIRTSSIKDHADTDQHNHSITLLTNKPWLQKFFKLTIPDYGLAKQQNIFDIYFVAMNNICTYNLYVMTTQIRSMSWQYMY